MNPGTTDTRIYRPAEVVSKLGVQQNSGTALYRGRHSTDAFAAPSERVGRHHVDDSLTRIIPPVQYKAAVPLAPRPAVPETVQVVPPEPVAPISDNLLRRVLRGLRVMK